GCDGDALPRIRAAVGNKRLRIPASHVVTEEQVRLCPRKPDRAAALGKLYFALVSTQHVVKLPGTLLNEAAEAYALQAAALRPYQQVTGGRVRQWRAAAGGRAPGVALKVAAQCTADAHDFLQFMAGALPAVRAHVAQWRASHRGQAAPTVADLWPT